MQKTKPLGAQLARTFKLALDPITALIHSQSFGGLLLAFAAFAALLMSNSPLAAHYQDLLHFGIQFRLGDVVDINESLHFWVNDFGMAIFFFLVGLEIKRELMEGELSSRAQAMLPAVAAVGGMLVPALIYFALNQHDPLRVRGWAIPSATDIAFALGILIVLGKRVPPALKILLTAIAIIDDLGAILIIAFFYTAKLDVQMLQYASYCVLLLLGMNRFGVTRVTLYMLVGLFLWFFMLKSGVHATLAGVITALSVPLYSRNAADGYTQADMDQGDAPRLHSPLKSAELALHHWVAFAILPVFAFLNAGLSLEGLSWDTLMHTIPVGIILGLVVGKSVGIFCFLYGISKWLKIPPPKGSSWTQVFALSLVCGVGFTMSLFIGGLAFAGMPEYETEVKVGVLTGSLLAGALGSVVFLLAGRRQSKFTVIK